MRTLNITELHQISGAGFTDIMSAEPNILRGLGWAAIGGTAVLCASRKNPQLTDAAIYGAGLGIIVEGVIGLAGLFRK